MLQGLGFSFPTLQGCYKQRVSCEEDDLSAELSHLVESVLDFANFVNKWRNMSDRVSKEMTEVDYIFWCLKYRIIFWSGIDIARRALQQTRNFVCQYYGFHKKFWRRLSVPTHSVIFTKEVHSSLILCGGRKCTNAQFISWKTLFVQQRLEVPSFKRLLFFTSWSNVSSTFLCCSLSILKQGLLSGCPTSFFSGWTRTPLHFAFFTRYAGHTNSSLDDFSTEFSPIPRVLPVPRCRSGSGVLIISNLIWLTSLPA